MKMEASLQTAAGGMSNPVRAAYCPCSPCTANASTKNLCKPWQTPYARSKACDLLIFVSI
jgi:hypothetical protein